MKTKLTLFVAAIAVGLFFSGCSITVEFPRSSKRAANNTPNPQSSSSEEKKQIADNIPMNEGLVAYYPFNGNTDDESLNGKNGENMGATLTVAPMLIEALMTKLSKVAPRVSLRIEERLSPQLVQAVASGELDVAVCFNASDDRRIDATPVFDEDICLVGAPELLGNTEDKISLEEALSFSLLLPGRDHILRGMIDRVALFRNRPIKVRHECLSLHALFAGLRLGLGATLISRFSALPLTRTGEVICRQISDPTVTRQLFIASSSERPKTTAQLTVIKVAQNLILENLASGNLPGARSSLPK